MLPDALKRTFRSLRVRNYRLYFVGQLVSVSGTWAQIVALGWLVYDISDHSALAVGVITAVQQVPMLVLGAWGGVLTDRFDKRRTLITTQLLQTVSALGLAAVALTHHATFANLVVLVTVAGVAQVVDLPCRQAFINEMVETDDVINAVGLNSAVYNGSRIVGPAVAGILLVTVGAGWCFFVNGISFLAVVGGLLAMRPHELRPSPVVQRAKGQVRAGFRYIAATPVLRDNLVLMAVTGTLAVNFPVVLPVLAKQTFHGDAGTYSILTGVMGVGALVGSLFAAARRTLDERVILLAAVAFGASTCVASLAPNLALFLPLVAVTGAASISLFATSNTLLQLRSSPEMRGRVLAVRGITVMGSTPIGAPITGFICGAWGPRWGFAVGGIATLLVAAWLWSSVRSRIPGALDLAVESAA